MEQEQEKQSYKSRLFNFKGMFESNGRHAKSLSIESASALDPTNDNSLEQNNDTKERMSREDIAVKEVRDKLLQGAVNMYIYRINQYTDLSLI